MGLLGYGERDSTPFTILALLLTSLLCFFAFFQWNLFSLIENSASTSYTSWIPLEIVMVWRFICAFIQLSGLKSVDIAHKEKIGPQRENRKYREICKNIAFSIFSRIT